MEGWLDPLAYDAEVEGVLHAMRAAKWAQVDLHFVVDNRFARQMICEHLHAIPSAEAAGEKARQDLDRHRGPRTRSGAYLATCPSHGEREGWQPPGREERTAEWYRMLNAVADKEATCALKALLEKCPKLDNDIKKAQLWAKDSNPWNG